MRYQNVGNSKVLNSYQTGPAPRSRSTSLAGSVAIHVGILLIVFQVRPPLESPTPRYTATQLYVPAAVSVPAAAARVKKTPALPLTAPRPAALSAKLPAPKPTPDLPAPPELSVTRTAPAPSRRPVLPAPATIPAPPSPVFAAALPAAPSVAHAAASRPGSFASVPVTTAPPPAAKLQVSGGTFDTVPADSPRRGSQPGAMLPAGFGAAGVASANPHHATSTAASNGFGGDAPAPPHLQPGT